jgi:RHS repeat-associated protein
LNRLSSALKTVTIDNAPTNTWSRTFAYDQYGNAWVPSVSGIGYGVSTPAWNVYNSATNQVVKPSTYTNSGGINGLPPGYVFSYDAENRVQAETSTNSNYSYNGLSERVEKTVGSTATVFVYDAFGNLAEEYSPYNVWSKDYIFFNGQTAVIENASANPCLTCYLSYDYLGTPRMVTDAAANVVARHDYLPFGDEIQAGWAGRSSQFGSGADNIHEKFTGQYRDPETLNDAFPARSYTAPLMRFLTPDPAGLASVDMTDPQTWNQYAYVRNNPLAFVDPSGMKLDDSDDDDPGGSGFGLGFPGIGFDPCDIVNFAPSDGTPPCGVSIPIVPVGGIGGHSGEHPGSSGGSSPTNPPPAAPVPPGSFPGGENLGLPPGFTIPPPWGFAGITFRSDVLPAGAAVGGCATDPICIVGGALIIGGYVVFQFVPPILTGQPTTRVDFTQPAFFDSPITIRGKVSDPYKLPRTNPGRGPDGNCLPCPDAPPAWQAPGNAHGSTTGTHWHWLEYNQNPVTCECFPIRRSAPTQP